MADEKDNESTELTVIDKLKESDEKLIAEIVNETDAEKLKDLTHVFNLFQTKRHILRVNALNDVQDALVQQMQDRLAAQPHNFNNSDIATWMKTVQQAVESAQKSIENVDSLPTIITQNNNTQNINISVADSLSRESREKILSILNTILPNIQKTDDGVGVLSSEGEDVIDIDDPTDEEIKQDDN